MSSFSHGAPLSPQRPRQGRGDSGVSAAVWEWLDLVAARSSTGSPYPPSGPGRPGGTRVYPPLCGSGWALCIPCSTTGRPYPTNGLGRTGGTRVYPPLCASGWTLCLLVVPWGARIPQTAEVGPGGLGPIRRCAGMARPCVSSFSHRESVSPKRQRQDRRDTGVSAVVWGWLGPAHTSVSRGVPYPPNGVGKTRGTRVYPTLCGKGRTSCLLVLP